MNDPIDYEKKILKVQELFRQATDAAGSLTPSSFTALNVQSIANKLTLIIDVAVRDAILQVTDNLKIENESLNIESIDVGLCNRLIDLCDKAIALWKAWHGKDSKTFLRQDEKKGEEAQQPLPVSPDVIVMSIKCFLKTILGHTSAMNNLSTLSPQTLINFGKKLARGQRAGARATCRCCFPQIHRAAGVIARWMSFGQMHGGHHEEHQGPEP